MSSRAWRRGSAPPVRIRGNEKASTPRSPGRHQGAPRKAGSFLLFLVPLGVLFLVNLVLDLFALGLDWTGRVREPRTGSSHPVPPWLANLPCASKSSYRDAYQSLDLIGAWRAPRVPAQAFGFLSPSLSRIWTSISSASSGLSFRRVFTFSAPWPRRLSL